MNLNLGLTAVVDTTKKDVGCADPLLLLHEFYDADTVFTKAADGYLNALQLSRLKKAGKLTSDMLELIGVENMQLVASMEDAGKLKALWQRIVAMAERVIAAFSKFIAMLRTKLRALLNRTRTAIANAAGITINKLVKAYGSGGDTLIYDFLKEPMDRLLKTTIAEYSSAADKLLDPNSKETKEAHAVSKYAWTYNNDRVGDVVVNDGTTNMLLGHCTTAETSNLVIDDLWSRCDVLTVDCDACCNKATALLTKIRKSEKEIRVDSSNEENDRGMLVLRLLISLLSYNKVILDVGIKIGTMLSLINKITAKDTKQ